MSKIVSFYKYQGTGNDFVIIDDRENKFDTSNPEVIRYICNRKFGIGADGLMLLRQTENYDFEMLFYNPDGSSDTFCGNGSRCIVKLALKLGLIDKKAKFLASDGPHISHVIEDQIKTQLRDVTEIQKFEGGQFFMDTGSPHHVIFVDNLDNIDIISQARAVRYSEQYNKEGVSVNFVQIVNQNHIKVRTYERGVEDETLSCGTGSTASAISLIHSLRLPENQEYSVTIQTQGGLLSAQFYYQNDNNFNNVFLQGPAVLVFQGEIPINE